MLGSDITDQYLDKLYDDFKKEQDRLMNDIKSGTEIGKEKSNQIQINMIHSILMTCLKLKRIRKKSIADM